METPVNRREEQRQGKRRSIPEQAKGDKEQRPRNGGRWPEAVSSNKASLGNGCFPNAARAESSKSQAPNAKQIAMTKYKIAKQEAASFGYWNFGFGICLGFGAWHLRFLARRAQE
jgi:hypothetical protein